MQRADPAGRGAARRVLPRPRRHRTRDDRSCGWIAVVRLPAARPDVRGHRSRSARRWSARPRVERKPILVADVPADVRADLLGAGRGLAGRPWSILPVLFEEQVLGVIELASFSPFSAVHLAVPGAADGDHRRRRSTRSSPTRAPRSCSSESQRLAAELQNKSASCSASSASCSSANAELEEKASLLAQQNRAIEIKNLEIEDARRALEDRAEQLALSSRYKSEFLANMSHELRTPLNTPADPGQAAGRQPRRQPRPASRSSSPRPSTAPAPTCSS